MSERYSLLLNNNEAGGAGVLVRLAGYALAHIRDACCAEHPFLLQPSRILFMTCLVWTMTGLAHAQTYNVSLVLSDNYSPYRRFADAFKRDLLERKSEVNILDSMGGGVCMSI